MKFIEVFFIITANSDEITWLFFRASVPLITQPVIKIETNSNGYGYVFGSAVSTVILRKVSHVSQG